MALRVLLVCGDATAVTVAGAIVAVSASDFPVVTWILASLPGWILLGQVHGLYREGNGLRHTTLDEVPRVVTWATIGTAVFAVAMTATQTGALTATAAIRLALFVALISLGLRVAGRATWRRVVPRERTLLVGSGLLAHATRRKLELFNDMHAEVIAEISDETLAHASMREPARMVEQQLIACGAQRLIIATDAIDGPLVAEIFAVCRRLALKLTIVPPVPTMFGTAVRLSHAAELPLIEYRTPAVTRVTVWTKRSVDVVVAAVGLVLLTPLLLAIAVAVRLASGAGPIYTQERAGRDGVAFRMHKFRTMVPDAESLLANLLDVRSLPRPVFKIPNDPRITPIGRLLRRFSLDELPQLINVLRGEMSLVGPRPEQLDLVARYTASDRVRLTVKPGITGPMQVFGRSDLTFDERLAVERDYIENMSFAQDARILALTVSVVLSGNGAC